ncbi:MAG: glycoside hydrolase 3 protein [Vezdaea aestivalis]|nr:MAG: glycoside hydrolase 3 protein [Vezdaea aestivalis]
MRFTSVLPLALAAAPVAVSAAGTLGFALGTKKPDGTCKYQQDYETDLDVIGTKAKIVRGYSASDCNAAQYLLPAAKAKGFKVVLGVWPDTDEAFNLDKGVIQQYASQYSDQLYAITVGSEALYRGSLTGETIASKLLEIKKVAPNAKLGTADSWNKYVDGSADAVVKVADIILVNAFSYWQGQDIKNATGSFFDDIAQATAHIQNIKGSTDGVELWVGETGWPTEGDDYEKAHPSIENAKTYFHSALCGIKAWGFNVFSFEAFDEPWKPVSKGQNGQVADERHWGVWNADRSPKFDINC